MKIQQFKPRFIFKALLGILVFGTAAKAEPSSHIIRGEFDVNNQLVDYDFVNSVVGWNDFFLSGFRGGTSSIGILEAGQAWFGHEVFVRPPGLPAAPPTFTTWTNTAPSSANEIDYHATTVAHVLAGSGDLPASVANYTVGDLARLGMAPQARVVSGGIATAFSSDPDNFGEFTVSTESVVAGYKEFFRGTNVGKLDVINSSWGGGGDGASNSTESLSIDGLAWQNPSTAHVISAGNGGSAQVGAPGNGFNNISVGSLGGTNYNTPSTFSSIGLADFYNPVTNTTTLASRVAVDIAAPGEDFYLAAYLGNSGSIGAALPALVQQPSPTDRYFIALSGTSYSAPIVAGGIALLKDVARAGLVKNTLDNPDYFDTRTIKSVIMAGSDATVGWNNGQNQFNVTTQALDTRTGAGQLDLLGAADVYLGATRGSSTITSGIVGASGWNLTSIQRTQNMDFVFDAPFTVASSITVALNWFGVRGFDDSTLGSDIAFANLNLEFWKLNDLGGFASMVGASQSTYNNTEFLRLNSLEPGKYGMRVLFPGMIYDTTYSINNTETFALAWSTVPIPEPSTAILSVVGVFFIVRIRRRPSH